MPSSEWGTVRGMWSHLWLLVRAAPGRQAINAIAGITADALVPAAAIGLKLLSQGVVAGNMGQAIAGGALMAGAGVAVDGLYWTGMALHFSLVERVGRTVDEELMRLSGMVPGIEHLERSDYHDRVELLREERDDLAQLPVSIVRVVSMGIRGAITLVLLASLHPVLLVLPLFGVPSMLIGRRSGRENLAVMEDVAEGRRRTNVLFDLATEAIAAKEVRIFGLGPTLVDRHVTEWSAVDAPLRLVERRTAIRAAVGWAVFALGFAGAGAFVLLRAVRGEATVGDVALALGLAMQVNTSLNHAVTTVGWFQYAIGAARRFLWLRHYAEAAVARTAPPRPQPMLDRVTQGIRLQAVSFTYPGSSAEILHAIDLDLPAGSTVALVGENGAGKTTLVKLLCRLYEPTAGTITVDGVRSIDIDPNEWRRRTSVGLQDHARFELAAREVVGVGDLARIADGARVREALERAASAEVVDGLPSGLETPIGRSFDRGIELSGGQWQKLALGRAMMRRRPLLLVLDEPTAALDAHSEHALFERYAAEAAHASREVGAITVLVSHRFSTVRMADLIVVLRHGRIIETGTHDALMRRDGVYAELYELQARAYR